jgi:hypothetical protein
MDVLALCFVFLIVLPFIGSLLAVVRHYFKRDA